MVNEEDLKRLKSAKNPNPDLVEFVAKRRPQYLAATAASIGFFGMGTIIAWSSPALPLLAADPTFNLTSSEMSWLAAFVPLGAFFGGPLAGYGIERYGRQRTLLMCCLPFTIGWIMVAMAQSMTMMYCGRFLTGTCCGAVTLAMPIYVSEFTEEKIRGLASSSSAVLAAAGLLVTNVIGTFASWQTLTILSATVPVIYSACLFNLHESPVYLLSRGKKKRATRALMWFRGAEYKEQVESELAEMRAALERSAPHKNMKPTDFFDGEVIKPTVVCMFLLFLQQFSGINSVVFYSVTIFQSAGAAIDPNLASIVVSLVFIAGVLLFSFLVEKIGRRTLLLLSGSMISISLLCIGYFFYALSIRDPIVQFISWLPLVSLVVFAVAFNIGFGPLPWIMMAEMVPTHVKGITSSIATAFNWILAFVLTKSFEDLNSPDALGAHGAYWLFAGVSAFGILFTHMFVPETRGKKLEEIQEFFRNSNGNVNGTSGGGGAGKIRKGSNSITAV